MRSDSSLRMRRMAFQLSRYRTMVVGVEDEEGSMLEMLRLRRGTSSGILLGAGFLGEDGLGLEILSWAGT